MSYNKTLPILGLMVAPLLFGNNVLAADWKVSGHDDKNSRYQSEETRIGPATVGNLNLRWSLNTVATSQPTRPSTATSFTFPTRPAFSTR